MGKPNCQRWGEGGGLGHTRLPGIRGWSVHGWEWRYKCLDTICPLFTNYLPTNSSLFVDNLPIICPLFVNHLCTIYSLLVNHFFNIYNYVPIICHRLVHYSWKYQFVKLEQILRVGTERRCLIRYGSVLMRYHWPAETNIYAAQQTQDRTTIGACVPNQAGQLKELIRNDLRRCSLTGIIHLFLSVPWSESRDKCYTIQGQLRGNHKGT